MKNYIPKSKGDFEAIENLKKMPFDVIKEDVPELLKWLQDMNWPIAYEVAAYLRPHINEIQQEIADILVSNDEMWVYWICLFVASSPERPSDDVFALISRIANNPTEYEHQEEIDEAAKEVLAKFP